ncbi:MULTISPECIES: hypothetical protein [Streptomyces violaceoruber group]|uniref:hypothetical protein n=1 Tax=Streptomyces violaceoruber group TaxID=2867121 RepID=UPI002DDA602C|nr:hypothetical protein [Streptomyces anthocyanicus]WSB62701.1 hypothetical protein OIE72_21670 [Streptomyces anthocyanicus]
MQLPEDQIRAGHIPADLYRQIPPGTDPRKVVIVQEAPRSYKGPIVLTLVVLAGSVAVLLVIAFVVQVIASAALAVLSATCGLSYTINRTGKAKGSSRRTVRRTPARSRPVRSKSHYRK